MRAVRHPWKPAHPVFQAARVRCEIDSLLAVGVLPADGRLRQQAGADGPAGRPDDAAAIGGGSPARGQGDLGPLASGGFLLPLDVRRQDGDAVGPATDLSSVHLCLSLIDSIKCNHTHTHTLTHMWHGGTGAVYDNYGLNIGLINIT